MCDIASKMCDAQCNFVHSKARALAIYRGEEAVIIRGKGRVIDNEKEFVKRTQEHVDKYHLQLDAQGRDSLGIPLFNKEVRCVIEVTPKRTIFW